MSSALSGCCVITRKLLRFPRILIEVLASKYVRDGKNTALPLQFTLTNDGRWTAMTFNETSPPREQSGKTSSREDFQIRIIALDSAFEAGPF